MNQIRLFLLILVCDTALLFIAHILHVEIKGGNFRKALLFTLYQLVGAVAFALYFGIKLP